MDSRRRPRRLRRRAAERPVRRRGPRRAGVPAHRSGASGNPGPDRCPARTVPALGPAARGWLHRRPALCRLRRGSCSRRVSRARRDPEVSGGAILRRPGVSRQARGCARRAARREWARRRPARAVLLPRRHRCRQLRSLPRALLRRRRVAEHVRRRSRNPLVRDEHRMPAPVHLLHEQPGVETHRAKALPADPAGAAQALGVPAADGLRRTKARGPRRDGERQDGLRGAPPHAERAGLLLRLPERHARGPPESRGDRAHEGAHRDAQYVGRERDTGRSRRAHRQGATATGHPARCGMVS